jgi:DNA-binding GntR family transcriptional regulator
MTPDPGARPARAYSSLREWAYLQLREMIVTGVLPPGADIHEGHLCAQLDISKTPLREALRQLAQEGLVVTASQRGSYVAPFSPEDIAEIYSLRSYVEALEVRRATERATDGDLHDLRANIAAMEECAQRGDQRGFVERDAEFHLLLARIADHSRLLRLQQWLQTDMLRLMMHLLAHAGDAAVTDASIMHRRIVDAVEARDPDAAERLMREHIHRGEILRGRLLTAPGLEALPTAWERVSQKATNGTERP